jgi:hypothetical protein
LTYEDDGSGVVEVPLTDASGESNSGQEFYLVVVNTADDAVGYQVRYDADTAPGPRPPARAMPKPRSAKPRITHMDPVAPPDDILVEADIGTASNEFRIRDDLTNKRSFATASATLWGLGDNVAIWVDDDVAVDWDYDCDGVVDEPARNDAYGFDNCDLADVAAIIDENIVPNLRGIFGDESDINGDGRVSIVITPVLNAITLTSSDDDDFTSVLPSYAEPEVDLEPFSSTSNPGSDGQEAIYVYAPDPYGFYNGSVTPSVDSYTGYQLAGEFARSFTKLISYNQHVIVNEGDQEEDWVVDALGTVGGDYCGFGASYYDDVWDYLDAPHLGPLVTEPSDGSLETLSYGSQYLFARWLYDRAEASSPGTGTVVLTSIMQSTETGTSAIEDGTGETMSDLALAWQVGMLTTGVVAEDGTPLVDPATFAPMADATTISAPPSSPGDFYGANGYQSGINVHGENHSFQGGTTNSPSEITDDLVAASNQYGYLYTPGFEFFGYAEGGYGASVVRLTGITYDAALLELQASGTGIVGAVVRWNDPANVNYTVEDAYSSRDVNPIDLPALPTDGTIITGEGNISESQSVLLVDSDGDAGSDDVDDTDRWLLDLTDRPPTSTVPVTVWLKRHFSDSTGSLGPADPWVAIVPKELIPEPTVTGTATNATCDGAPEFGFPTSMLVYLNAQQFLSSTMMTDGEFDACSSTAEGADSAASTPTCAEDWDLDGVADDNEPLPESLEQQILVAECTADGATNETFVSHYDTDWMDADEQDDDERPSHDYVNNTGGRSGADGEEGYVHADLPGGAQYLLIVGGNGETGTYEINVRQTLH